MIIYNVSSTSQYGVRFLGESCSWPGDKVIYIDLMPAIGDHKREGGGQGILNRGATISINIAAKITMLFQVRWPIKKIEIVPPSAVPLPPWQLDPWCKRLLLRNILNIYFSFHIYIIQFNFSRIWLIKMMLDTQKHFIAKPWREIISFLNFWRGEWVIIFNLIIFIPHWIDTCNSSSDFEGYIIV